MPTVGQNTNAASDTPPTAGPATSASGPALPTSTANTVTVTEVTVVPDELSDSDTDSVRGESVASSSTSLRSSVLQYRIENGRTYHSYKEGKYTMPNDERENDRLDVQHNMFLLTFDGRLGTAPPNEPGSKVGRVLDVGTGTGVWALDFGEDHPDAEIIGVDLSANQPGFTLPNVVFEVDDVEEDWMWSQPFDYIHSRMMNSSISNWKSYIQKCFDNLSSGGYLELNEISLMPRSDDGTLKEDCGLLKFSRMWGEAAAMFGRPFLNDLTVLKDYLLEVGFEDVHAQMFKWPSNPWAKEPKYKEIGLWNLENSVANLEGFMMAPLTRAHEWSREEVTVFAMQVRKEMTDRSIHSYSVIWSIYGRKPAAKAQAQAGA